MRNGVIYDLKIDLGLKLTISMSFGESRRPHPHMEECVLKTHSKGKETCLCQIRGKHVDPWAHK